MFSQRKKNPSKKASTKSCHRCLRSCVVFTHRPRKSNVTADRLTLLPGFLSKGVKSFDSSTSPEDDPPPNVTRSWRVHNKNEPVTVSGYFSKLVQVDKKRIDEGSDDDFESKLPVNLKNLRNCEEAIKGVKEEIRLINSLLTGKGRNMSVNRKRALNEEDKENFSMKFPYVPPANWVFQTPPNRKLNYNNVKCNENTIKPAVIETRNNKKVVYEMNSKINVDLTSFATNQGINIDKRYMVEVTDSNFEEDKEFTDSHQLETHFLSLTCRPKKAVPTLPKFPAFKRKRGDIFEPQPGCSTDADEYKPNVCFLDSLNGMEESFTFKFTSNDTNEGSTTGHLFDYDGNEKNTFNFRF